MKYTSFIPVGLIAVLLFVVGCRKDTLGPSLVEIYGPVTVTEPFATSNVAVDFSKNEQIHFTAKFEKDAAWIVTVKGDKSGAVKTFEGESKTVDISNANWTGYANDAPSFQAEPVTATLSFKHTNDVFSKTLTVLGQKNLDLNNVLISDFSTIFKISSWTKYEGTINVTHKLYPQADGNKYLYMEGTPYQETYPGSKVVTPFVCGIEALAKNAEKKYDTYYPLSSDTTKVYFNVMVYGTGHSNTWLKIVFDEEQLSSRHIDIRPNWTGWKLISVTYAKLLDDVSTAGKPDKLTKVKFLLLSDAVPAESEKVSVAIDHPCFTTNAPYQP